MRKKYLFKKSYDCIKCMVMLLLLGLFGCDSSLSPIIEGDSIYTIYGILDNDRATNFIRVNDIKTIATSEEELELNVTVSLTDMSTSNTEILQDSIIVYDNNYITNNFYTNTPIKFDTKYRVTVQDSVGNEINVDTRTPAEIQSTVTGENRLCKQSFFVDLQGFNLEEGEVIEYELGMEYRNRMVWVSYSDPSPDYDSNSNTLSLSFTPNLFISEFLSPGEFLECIELSSDILRIRFIHFGGFDEEQNQTVTSGTGNTISGGQIIYGKYSREIQIQVNTDEFDNLADPC